VSHLIVDGLSTLFTGFSVGGGIKPHVKVEQDVGVLIPNLSLSLENPAQGFAVTGGYRCRHLNNDTDAGVHVRDIEVVLLPVTEHIVSCMMACTSQKLHEIVQVLFCPESGTILAARVQAADWIDDQRAYKLGAVLGVDDLVGGAVAVLKLVVPTAREHALLIAPPLIAIDEATVWVFEIATARSFMTEELSDTNACIV